MQANLGQVQQRREDDESLHCDSIATKHDMYNPSLVDMPRIRTSTVPFGGPICKPSITMKCPYILKDCTIHRTLWNFEPLPRPREQCNLRRITLKDTLPKLALLTCVPRVHCYESSVWKLKSADPVTSRLFRMQSLFTCCWPCDSARPSRSSPGGRASCICANRPPHRRKRQREAAEQ